MSRRPEDLGIRRVELPAPGEILDVCWFDEGAVCRGTVEGSKNAVRLTMRGYLPRDCRRPGFPSTWGALCPDLYHLDDFVVLAALLHAGLIGDPP